MLAALRRIELQKKGLSSGRTSSSESSSAGIASWRAASSVNTCPVTLARMVRESSLSSRWRVSPEEVEHRKIGRGLAVGHRRTFEHEPSLGAVGMHKLVDQARLPDPGLHYRRHLPMPRPGLLQGLLQRLQLMVPSDKPAQPPRHGRLRADG